MSNENEQQTTEVTEQAAHAAAPPPQAPEAAPAAAAPEAAPAAAAPAAAAPAAAPAAPMDQNTKVGMIAVGIIAVVIIALVASLFGRSEKSTIDKFLEAAYSADAQAVLKLVPSKAFDDLDDDDYDYVVDMLEDALEYDADRIASRLGLRNATSLTKYMNYEIEDSDSLTGSKLAKIQDTYSELGIKVKAASYVEIDIWFNYDGEMYETSGDLTLIKVGSTWYIDMSSMM